MPLRNTKHECSITPSGNRFEIVHFWPQAKSLAKNCKSRGPHVGHLYIVFKATHPRTLFLTRVGYQAYIYLVETWHGCYTFRTTCHETFAGPPYQGGTLPLVMNTWFITATCISHTQTKKKFCHQVNKISLLHGRIHVIAQWLPISFKRKNLKLKK